MDWFEKYYPYVPLIQDDCPFFIQRTNRIQEKNPGGRQWNRILDAGVTMLK